MKLSLRNTAILSSAALFFSACGPQAPKQSVVETANSFKSAIETAQLKKAWDLMPDTYKSDVKTMTSYFADEVNKEKYDRFIGIVGKYEKALTEKKALLTDFIYDMNKDKPDGPHSKAEVEKGLDSITAILSSILKSDLSSLDRLKKIDLDKFWSGSASQLLKDLRVISETSTDENLAKLKTLFATMKFDVISETSDVSKLKVTYKDSKTGEELSKEILLSNFEGKWVPFDMVQKWDGEMSQIKADIDQLLGKNAKEGAGMVSMFLGVAEYLGDELLKVESVEDLKKLYLNSPFGRPMLPKVDTAKVEDLKKDIKLDNSKVDDLKDKVELPKF